MKADRFFRIVKKIIFVLDDFAAVLRAKGKQGTSFETEIKMNNPCLSTLQQRSPPPWNFRRSIGTNPLFQREA